MTEERNVLREEIRPCSEDPVTGFLRDGMCRHMPQDQGRHEICAVMTDEFLDFAAARGNNLRAPIPHQEFPGIESGDRWCVSISHWIDAYHNECAPPVVLDATNEAVLEKIPFETLREHSSGKKKQPQDS